MASQSLCGRGADVCTRAVAAVIGMTTSGGAATFIVDKGRRHDRRFGQQLQRTSCSASISGGETTFTFAGDFVVNGGDEIVGTGSNAAEFHAANNAIIGPGARFDFSADGQNAGPSEGVAGTRRFDGFRADGVTGAAGGGGGDGGSAGCEQNGQNCSVGDFGGNGDSRADGGDGGNGGAGGSRGADGASGGMAAAPETSTSQATAETEAPDRTASTTAMAAGDSSALPGRSARTGTAVSPCPAAPAVAVAAVAAS